MDTMNRSNQLTLRWLLLLALGLTSGCGDASSADTGADTSLLSDAGVDTADQGQADALEGLSDSSEPTDTEEEAEVNDILSAFPSDLPVITDIDEDVDLSEFFPDAVGPDADPSDVAEEELTDASLDVPMPEADSDAIEDSLEGDTDAEDAGEDLDTFLADCENLGVAPQWSGSFDGAIEYHIPEALEDLFYPTDGILIVGGSLAFDIECVDSKLIVSGDMDGTANVAGEGDFPFTVGLAGYFNPETGLLNASLVEGMVVLYGLAEIYFSGDFVGTLNEEVFDGTWTATYDGTNFPLPPGDVPEADGLGTWTTQALEVD